MMKMEFMSPSPSTNEEGIAELSSREKRHEEGNVILGLESNLKIGQALSVTLHRTATGECKVQRIDKSGREIIVAGPTNPLSIKRVKVLRPTRFREEPLNLECEWQECTFKTVIMDEFMDHVGAHVPVVEVVLNQNFSGMKVVLNCNWRSCPWNTDKTAEDLQRHLYLHAYHVKLKCIGTNTIQRSDLNQCNADSSNRNVLPDLSENLLCAWENCSQQFTNIQIYYNHIAEHIDSTPRGKNVPGGIKCCWRGCSSVFPNAVKLRDHMRSHTQEKLVACPTCGGLFANRTRFFDHCRRQVLMEDESFACDVCMKCFSTARLLRDHIRSHVNTYKCPKCEMSCSSPSALKSHMNYKHSDRKPYPCQYCDYSCKSYNDIVRHVKTHSGIRIKCEEDECDFECKSLGTLKAHWAKTHGDGKRKYSCHICDRRFYRGHFLTKHLSGIHKLQWPAGHSRFRYKLHDDGLYRLLTVRYESVEEPQQGYKDPLFVSVPEPQMKSPTKIVVHGQ